MTSMPSSILHPRRFFLLCAILFLVAGGVERGLQALHAARAPDVGAEWIWATGTLRKALPTAFYAVRDIDLPSAEAAWMAVAADESYVLYVNGLLVGGNTWREGGGLDLYDVTDLLDAGWNRLVIEVASSRGAGGLLASLRIGDPHRVALGTDASWTIVRRAAPEVLRGLPFTGEAPQVWGPSPLGRRHPTALEARPAMPITALFAPDLAARRVRFAAAGAPWMDLSHRRLVADLGERLVFDWGETVCGRLELELAPDSTSGLLDLGLEPPPDDIPATPEDLLDETHSVPSSDEVIVPVPETGDWLDRHGRCFRYARLLGVRPRAVPAVRGLPPDILEAWAVPDPEVAGIWGLEPPAPTDPAQAAVRRRIDRKALVLD